MTKIRAVEQQMRDSVEAKDVEQLDAAIEIGHAINVVRIRRIPASILPGSPARRASLVRAPV